MDKLALGREPSFLRELFEFLSVYGECIHNLIRSLVLSKVISEVAVGIHQVHDNGVVHLGREQTVTSISREDN